jgi:CheY-like chemotaxis protein
VWAARIDRGPLEQVLLNLTVNARDAMPNGGTLILRTRNLEVPADDPRCGQLLEAGPFVEVIVSDSGAGMAPTVLERAFEPFFSTKPKTQGTGLGLSTVYGIVRQAGGDVELVSELGAGTVVRLLLPADPDRIAPNEPNGSEVAPRGHGETVLVVEDQADLRELVATILAHANYRVVTAADGSEALVRAAREDRIDLLLTDVVMPRMSGRELADRLAEERVGLGVLFMSGYSAGILSDQPSTTSGRVVLDKPFTPDQLLVAVAAALAGSCP